MLGADIVSRCRQILNDTASPTRFADADFVPWINDGVQYIGAARPDTLAVTATVSLAAGTKQSLTAFTPVGTRLLDVIRSGTQAVRLIDRNELDSINPTWHNDTQSSTVKNYCYDNRSPQLFWVYPPATAAAPLDLVYEQVPTPITTGTLGSSALPIPDQYIDALTSYVLSRCYSRESEDDFYAQLAATYRKQCDDFVIVKTPVDLKFSPDLNNPGGVINKSASVGGV